MARLDDLTIKLNAIDKSGKAFKSMTGRVRRLEKSLLAAKFAAGAIAVAAVGTAATMTRVFNTRAPYIDAMSKTADTLGLGVEQLQAFRREAELSGVSIADVDKALSKMNIRIGRAVDGGGAAAKALKKLGLDASELSNLNPQEAYVKITRELEKIPTVAERSAIAMDIFGKKGAEVTRITADNLEKSVKELEEFGLALSRVDGAKIEDANDAVFRVKQNLQGVSNLIAVGMAPAITAVSNFVLDLSRSMLGANGDLLDIGRTLVRGIGWVGDFTSAFWNGLSMIRILINQTERGISELFLGAIDGINSFLSKLPGGAKLAEKFGLTEASAYFKNEIAKTTQDIGELQQSILDSYSSGSVSARLEQYFNEAEAAAIIRAREIEAGINAASNTSGAGASPAVSTATGAGSPVVESGGDDIEAAVLADIQKVQALNDAAAEEKYAKLRAYSDSYKAYSDGIAAEIKSNDEAAAAEEAARQAARVEQINQVTNALGSGASAFGAFASAAAGSSKKAFNTFKILQIGLSTAAGISAQVQALAAIDAPTLTQKFAAYAQMGAIVGTSIASLKSLTLGGGGGSAGASASAPSASPQSTARGGTVQQSTARATSNTFVFESRDSVVNAEDVVDSLKEAGYDINVQYAS